MLPSEPQVTNLCPCIEYFFWSIRFYMDYGTIFDKFHWFDFKWGSKRDGSSFDFEPYRIGFSFINKKKKTLQRKYRVTGMFQKIRKYFRFMKLKPIRLEIERRKVSFRTSFEIEPMKLIENRSIIHIEPYRSKKIFNTLRA